MLLESREIMGSERVRHHGKFIARSLFKFFKASRDFVSFILPHPM